MLLPQVRCRRAWADRPVRRVSVAPYDALNLGDHVGDDPAAVASNRALAGCASRTWTPAHLVFMQPGARHATSPWSTGRGPGAAAGGRRAGHRRPGLGARGARRRLRARPARRPPQRRRRRGARRAAAGSRPGVVRRHRGAPCSELGARPDADRRRGRSGHLRAAATRCRRRCADEVGAAVPAARSTTRAGTPGLDLRAGVSPSCWRRASRRSRSTRGAPPSAATSTPTAGTASPAGSPGLVVASGMTDEPRPTAGRRDELAGRWPRCEARIAAACAGRRPRPGRGDRWSPSPRRSRPATSALLAALGRARRRREPGPRRPPRRRPRAGQRASPACAGTSSDSCRPTRRRRSPAMPTSSTRSTGCGW